MPKISETMKNAPIKYVLAFCLTVCFSDIFPQSEPLQWSDMAATLLLEDDYDSDSDLYELLEELHENPIDINAATAGKLSVFPFLSLRQIEDIVGYVDKNGNMMTLGELQLIGSLDYDTRMLLSCFVYAGKGVSKSAGPGSFGNLLRHGRHRLMLNSAVPLYERSGFKDHAPDELERYPNRAYLGNKIPHSLRYSFNWNDRIRFGLNAGKDAGEPFSRLGAPWYDYLSAYLSIDGSDHLRHLTVGNVKASFGMGLVMNTSFGLGKQMALGSMDRQSQGFRPHSSNSETGYFTGAGGTMAFGRFSVSAMASYTMRDATLKDGMVSSFKTDGYHRTPLELSKRHNTAETASLVHATWSWNGNHLGATLLFDRFDRIVVKYGTNIFWNAAVDWSFRWRRLSLMGEAAVAGPDGLAALNFVRYRLPGRTELSLILRHYSPGYVAFNGKAFSESGLSNESGVYIGARTRFEYFDLSLYCDIFRFAEPGYRTSEPAGGIDSQVQLAYSRFNSSDKAELRYRFKSRSYDSNVAGSLASRATGRLKLVWSHRFAPSLSLKSLLNFTHTFFPDSGFEKGFSLSECLDFSTAGGRFSGSVTIGLFCTDSGNASVSLYENGLLYDYNFITLSGRGTRNSFVIKYKVLPSLVVTVKFGSTVYFDRATIGSSQQQINSFHKEDVLLQIQLKL